MAIQNQTERQFKRNPIIDQQLNEFIENNQKLANYVKELPREELERKYLLSKMREEKQREGYDKKVSEFISRPEHAAFRQALTKNLPQGLSESEQRRALLKEAKQEIRKQGIKMSM
jgi:hypothetical protein